MVAVDALLEFRNGHGPARSHHDPSLDARLHGSARREEAPSLSRRAHTRDRQSI